MILVDKLKQSQLLYLPIANHNQYQAQSKEKCVSCVTAPLLNL